MIIDLLNDIYDDEILNKNMEVQINRRIKAYKSKITNKNKAQWNESDLFLITYADQFYEDNQPKLLTFNKFYTNYLSEIFPIVHLLPFYPYTSDDGFSVTDYEKVKSDNGDWADIQVLSNEAKLMFDFVCNHMSAKSEWFQGYLNDVEEFKDFFIEMDPKSDLSSVTRPRTSPLLTNFIGENGNEKYIWTTFSDDQVDLNFSNPKVLLRMIDVLLFYLDQGAQFIRLDAIGYMWKEVGTSSIHLEKTHKIVQLFREVVDAAAPGTTLITETNVPHKDNISYFGNGYNEAQIVYNFPLPPLVLHTIKTGSARYINKWTRELTVPSEETTFFNFLASHDGIGVNPIRGIVEEDEILELVKDIEENGGLVNYKNNSDGTSSPYEINATYMDALSSIHDTDDLRLKRFLVAHSILITFKGIPAIYIQSILGSRNYLEGVKNTGANRTINREKYEYDYMVSCLNDSNSLRSKTFLNLKQMIKNKRSIEQLHPNETIKVIDSNDGIFGYERGNGFLAIHNISSMMQEIELDEGRYTDVLHQFKEINNKLILKPYEFVWLIKNNNYEENENE